MSVFYMLGLPFHSISHCILCVCCPCTVHFHPHIPYVVVSLLFFPFTCVSVSLVYLLSCFFFNFITISAHDCFIMSLYLCLFPFIAVLLLFFPRSFPHFATFHGTFSTLPTSNLFSPRHTIIAVYIVSVNNLPIDQFNHKVD